MPDKEPIRSMRHSPDNSSDVHWSVNIAQNVIQAFPNVSTYTFAAGISPSGIVHFGNFRDVMTSLSVANAVIQQHKSVRLLFSWDDFDRFRKVPVGIDPSFREHIGRPLALVPDPLGELPSYAARFEMEFESSMEELGISLEYRYQMREYKSGKYDSLIRQAIDQRREIANILLSFMSEKGKDKRGLSEDNYRESYFPISVYSRFTGKDNTEIISFDDTSSLLTYRCKDTDKTDVVDLAQDRIAKLAWKIDWPMRWKIEDVVFEPGGHDHASPGGSYDVSSVISRQIFNREPPIFVGYEFIGLQGIDGKMSGSSGLAVSPLKLLEIYEPELLKWLYTRRTPDQGFTLAFDSEIFRQYDEFDREVQDKLEGKLPTSRQMALDLSFHEGDGPACPPIPFRQAVGFGQILQWSVDKMAMLSDAMALNFNNNSVKKRLKKAKAWLETYNPQAVLKLNETINHEYAKTMSTEAFAYVLKLREALCTGMSKINEIELLVYAIPKDISLDQKENAKRQRAFFKDVYSLLLGSDTGPRLSTFLWAVDRAHVLRLLDIQPIDLY